MAGRQHYENKRKVKMTLENVNNIKRDTCESKDNMKTTLIKVKINKNDFRKHESNICECEGVKKRQLEKIIEIEVQSQPKVRDCK